MKVFRWILAGVITLMVGGFSNLLVISLNGGMPVSGLIYPIDKWVPLTEQTKLPYLGDILGTWSIGDWLLIIGYMIIAYGVILWLKRREHENNNNWGINRGQE